MSNVPQCSYADRVTYWAVIAILLLAVLTLLPPDMTIVFVTALTIGIGAAAYYLGNYLLAVLAIAFLFRIAVVLANGHFQILPVPPIAPFHSQRGTELAAAWSHGQFLHPPFSQDLMRMLLAYLIAPFYVFFGETPVAGRLGIAFISLFVGYFVYRLATPIVPRRTAILASAFVLFWPTIVYRSVVIQREIVGVVALLAFLWAAVQWLDRISLLSVVVAIAASGTVFVFRKENLVLITAVLGMLFLIKSRDRPYYLAGVTFFSVPFFVYFVLNFGQFTGFGTTLTPAALDAFAYGRAHGDAAYLVGLHYRSWFDVVLYTPLKIVYFLYTPFPWYVRSVTELVVGASATALFIATILSRRGIVLLKEHRGYLFVLLTYLSVGITAYAVVEMNYGAAVRRRIQFIPILILFAVVGISNIRLRIKGNE